MLIVSKETSYQLNALSKFKIKVFAVLQPQILKLNKILTFFSFESLLVYYFFLVLLLGRSFTGIGIFGFRVGELMIGSAMVLFIYFVVFKSKKVKDLLNDPLTIILRLIFITFIVINTRKGGFDSFLNVEVYRSSSYMWSIGFLFVLNFINKARLFDSSIFFTGLCFILPCVYILTSVYYPNFLDMFFMEYSDKLRLLKGSDLFIAYAIYCFLFFERIKNNNFIYIFTFVISGLLIPLIVFSSRGASIGTFLVLIYCIFRNKNAFLRNKFLFFGSLIGFIATLTLSSIYLDWTKIDFQEINTSMAIDSLEMTLISKRYPETTKPYLFIEDNRINSGDGNLNWRLQIWQDVTEDLSDKKILFTGYGYENVIPAMAKLDRMGLDGTNIHVHNYFINILARGGLIHLVLFILFYMYLIKYIYEKKKSHNATIFIGAILFVAFFDSSMETVRYPFLFYTILSYKLVKE